MGKTNKKANAAQVAGSEGFQRLNFLFQVSFIENFSIFFLTDPFETASRFRLVMLS
jgi:hypothetical protein